MNAVEKENKIAGSEIYGPHPYMQYSPTGPNAKNHRVHSINQVWSNHTAIGVIHELIRYKSVLFGTTQ